MSESKRNVLVIAVGMMLCVIYLAGCGSVTTTETTEYTPDGKIQKTTKIVKDSMAWPLKHKGFSMQSSGFVGEIVTTMNQNGSISPTIRIADLKNSINDIPMADNPAAGTNYLESLQLEKSLWGAELSNVSYNRQSSGPVTPPPSVKINLDAASIVPSTGGK